MCSSIAVFFFTTLGLGPYQLGKIAAKQEILEISSFIQVVIKLKHNASFLGILEITDNPGQFFLSYNISFSFLF
jgi:hypothetical protein